MPRLLLLCMLAGTHECARSCVLSCSSSCATVAVSTLWQAKLAAWGIACRQVQKIQVETKTPQLTTALAAIQSSTDAAGQVRGCSSLCAPSCMLCVLWSTMHALPTVCGRLRELLRICTPDAARADGNSNWRSLWRDRVIPVVEHWEWAARLRAGALHTDARTSVDTHHPTHNMGDVQHAAR
jgi:hypothetical protein